MVGLIFFLKQPGCSHGTVAYGLNLEHSLLGSCLVQLRVQSVEQPQHLPWLQFLCHGGEARDVCKQDAHTITVARSQGICSLFNQLLVGVPYSIAPSCQVIA